MGQSTNSGNPATAMPLKLELVVDASLQDAQHITDMPLWKAKLEEPRSDQSDNSSKRKKQTRRGYISHARSWARVDRRKCTPHLTPSVPLLRDAVEVEPSTNFESKEGIGGSGICVICVDASAEAAFVPCGHVAGCISCLKEIKNKKLGCPICRASIDQVIKLYHV
ncbi:hypothetical protein HA466_0099070 [Hirschfeldia incana]|nr:hypothetical protein HA466_0099070 [Hirschfeldia incana]